VLDGEAKVWGPILSVESGNSPRPGLLGARRRTAATAPSGKPDASPARLACGRLTV